MRNIVVSSLRVRVKRMADGSQKQLVAPTMGAKIKGLISLLRLTFHHNYILVVLGALIYGQKPLNIPALMFRLFLAYFPFNVMLYGGIYTLNAVTDLDMDRIHPVKKHRPVPSGLVTPTEALAFFATMVLCSYVTAYIQWGDMRLFPIYTAFLVTNILYSTWFRRIPSLRPLIGITSPFRVMMGATIADGGNIPILALLCCMGSMVMIQVLRAKLDRIAIEGQGILAMDRELPWLSFAVLSAPIGFMEHPLWVNLAIHGLTFAFVIFPYLRPRIGSKLLRADVPKNLHRLNTWTTLHDALWKGFAIKSIFLHILLFIWAFLNRSLMEIEEMLIPGLSRAIPKRVVWITGHHRSGTTALHSALHTSPNVVSATNYDLFFPSIILKFLCKPLFYIIDYICLLSFDTANHPFRLNEEAEEHIWLLFHSTSEAVFAGSGFYLKSEKDFLKDFSDVTEAQMEFIERCIQRVCWFRGCTEDTVYVGKPLLLTQNSDLLLKKFPDSKMILCLRQPRETFPSWVAMTQAQFGADLGDETFRHWIRHQMLPFSKRMYEGSQQLAQLVSKDKTIIVKFEDWKATPETVISNINKFASLKESSWQKSESTGPHHKNPTEAAAVVTPSELDKELGLIYKSILASAK